MVFSSFCSHTRRLQELQLWEKRKYLKRNLELAVAPSGSECGWLVHIESLLDFRKTNSFLPCFSSVSFLPKNWFGWVIFNILDFKSPPEKWHIELGFLGRVWNWKQSGFLVTLQISKQRKPLCWILFHSGFREMLMFVLRIIFFWTGLSAVLRSFKGQNSRKTL